MLILHLEILPNLLFSSTSFQWNIQNYLYIISQIYQNHICKYTFTFIFLISKFFIFLFYLITMARTSSTMLYNSDKNGHPCCIPDLRENLFSLLSVTMTTVCLSYMAFTALRYISSIHNLLSLFYFVYSFILFLDSSVRQGTLDVSWFFSIKILPQTKRNS